MKLVKRGSDTLSAAPLLILFALSLAGCSLHSGKLVAPSEASPTTQVEGVPFYAQEAFLCGPASLAMALTWSGVPVTPDSLVESVYTPEERGSFQNEMITATRRHGRMAYPVIGPDALVAELAQGHPVVVLQNLGLSWYPQWHYAVVIGYDQPANEVIMHTGAIENRRVSFPVFENTWARSGFWGLLVLPPSTLPATAEEKLWLKGAVGLERAKSLAEAQTAYATATRRWPLSYDAWMGLGNTDYAMDNKPGAAQAFHRATIISPDNGIAFNNLAHVLAELGQREAALKAARQAVAIGGPYTEVFRKTLSEIE